MEIGMDLGGQLIMWRMASCIVYIFGYKEAGRAICMKSWMYHFYGYRGLVGL